jgi:dipeptidase E
MSKLVLYSDQVPAAAAVDRALAALFDAPAPTVGYIPASGDPQRIYYAPCRTYYARLGMRLAPYFELDDAYNPALRQALFACDAIHLSGGNTFYFLHRLRQRDMLDPLRAYVAGGGVLIGVSAGAILITPDISTAALCGDRPVAGEDDLSALGLVDFGFVPHVGRIPAGQAALRAYARQRQRMVYACPDGSGIVAAPGGGEVRCIGQVTVIDG